MILLLVNGSQVSLLFKIMLIGNLLRFRNFVVFAFGHLAEPAQIIELAAKHRFIMQESFFAIAIESQVSVCCCHDIAFKFFWS